MRRILITTLFFTALIVIWQAMANSGWWSPMLPAPSDVVVYLWHAAQDDSLWKAAAVTMERLLIGYAVGVATGLSLGVLSVSVS